MGLPNLIYNGNVPYDTLLALGVEQTMYGFFSFAGKEPIRRWHVKANHAKVFIHAVVPGLGDFGNYTITIEKRAFITRIMHVNGEHHPHYYGTICWGSLGSSVEYAMQRHDIEAVAGFCVTALTNYWPDGAYDGWWGDKDAEETAAWVCISCGDGMPDYTCGSCSSYVCQHCSVTCQDAIDRGVGIGSSRFCRHCVFDTLCIGEECSHRTCWNHPLKDVPQPVEEPKFADTVDKAAEITAERLREMVSAVRRHDEEPLPLWATGAAGRPADASSDNLWLPEGPPGGGYTYHMRGDGTAFRRHTTVAGDFIEVEVPPEHTVQLTLGLEGDILDVQEEERQEEDHDALPF